MWQLNSLHLLRLKITVYSQPGKKKITSESETKKNGTDTEFKCTHTFHCYGWGELCTDLRPCYWTYILRQCSHRRMLLGVTAQFEAVKTHWISQNTVLSISDAHYVFGCYFFFHYFLFVTYDIFCFHYLTGFLDAMRSEITHIDPFSNKSFTKYIPIGNKKTLLA